MIDLLTFGETMAAMRAEQPLAQGGPLRLSVAGAESTVAIGVSRLGHRARWVGLTGADEFGRLIHRTLRAEGVDTTYAATRTDAPTGLIVFEPRIADLVRVSYYRTGSAGSQLTPEHLTSALAEGTRVLHLTGVTAALGTQPRAALAIAAAAIHAASGTVCLDVNHRARLWSEVDAAAALRPLLPHIDILIASEDELAIATPGTADTEAARVTAALNAGVREVVVKRGATGAEVFTPSGATARPAVPVPVRDTVGAGDAFVAGYLSGLLDGLPIDQRLDRAVTTGAFAVASTGDWEGLPTRAELDLLHHPTGHTLR